MPAAQTTYTVTLPDGGVINKRTSRVLTHVNAILSSGVWSVQEWCSREDLAAKSASRSRHLGATDARAIPVTVA